MPRYHVNPETELPGECNAKVRCPFGVPLDEHSSTPQEALERFMGEAALKDALKGTKRKVEHHSPQAQAFAGKIGEGLQSMELAYGEWSFPATQRERWGTTSGTMWLLKTVGQEAEESFGRRLFEEEILVANRSILPGLAGCSLEDEDTWRDYHRLLGEHLKNAEDVDDEPPSQGASYEAAPQGKVGTREEAAALVVGLRDFAPGSLEPQLRESDRGRELAPGFIYLGSGFEAAAFQAKGSGAIYKVAHNFRDPAEEGCMSSGRAYVMNALAAQEAFPKGLKGLRHARTAAYGVEGVDVLAQEPVAGISEDWSESDDLTKNQKIWLGFTGHDDAQPGNYGRDAQGNFVAFDTFGSVFDDLESYRPSGLTELQ